MSEHPSMDQQLLDKLHEIIEDNLNNEQFGVTELAKESGISKSQLNRKLKSLTGKSASQMIRELRLKKANQLLQDDVANVAEVAYLVGFGSPSYFSTCFHDYFGYSPVEVKYRTEANKKRKSTIQKVVLMALVVAIVLLLVNSLIDHLSDNKPEPGKIKDKSIAVLPFDYLSQEADKQYLADGVMEAITSNLAKISELKVIAKTSVMKYKEENTDVRDIGKELDVSYIVEGSFQLVGDQARLIIQLINTIDGSHVWSNEYDKEWADIFKVQSEVSQTIANEIAVNITPETKIIIDSPPTNDLTAYDFYLRGQDYLSRSYEQEDFSHAMQMYKKAIEIDSNFALAWVGMAVTSRNLYWFYHDHTNDRLQTTKLFLTSAIKLNPELVEVKIEKAKYLYHCERRYLDALTILNNLKSQYPKSHDIYFWIGVIYKRMGEFGNSLEYYNYAIKLNPSDWKYWNDAGIVYLFKGDYDNAYIFFKRSIELNPSIEDNLRRLFILYSVKGEWDKLKTYLIRTDLSIELIELQIMDALIDYNYKSAIEKNYERGEYIINNAFEYHSNNLDLGMMFLLNSNEEKAIEYFIRERSYLENLIALSPNDYRLYKSICIVYAGLGEKQKAKDAGEKAVQLMGIEKDAIYGVLTEIRLARILLMIEEFDEGISKLQYLLENTGRISVEYLKNHYLWKGFMKNEKYRALVNNPKYQLENLSKSN